MIKLLDPSMPLVLIGQVWIFAVFVGCCLHAVCQWAKGKLWPTT